MKRVADTFIMEELRKGNDPYTIGAFLQTVYGADVVMVAHTLRCCINRFRKSQAATVPRR